jgi:hypothetical protein
MAHHLTECERRQIKNTYHHSRIIPNGQKVEATQESKKNPSTHDWIKKK